MKILDLSRMAQRLTFNAFTLATTGRPELALPHLVKLRELLNNEPQLEAGGALNPESKEQH